MRFLRFIPALLAAASILPALAEAPAAPAPAPDHRSERVVAALQLSDPAQSARVLAILSEHAAALHAWHAQHDAELKPAWEQWAKLRNEHDPAALAAASAALDRIYASLRPEHDRFLAALHGQLAPAQAGTAEDRLIDEHSALGRVESTYRVYLQEFPALTDPQKAFVLARLQAARDEAVDAQSSAEKASIFKRRKDEIEAYLGAQGYDVKAMIHAFGQKLKEQN